MTLFAPHLRHPFTTDQGSRYNVCMLSIAIQAGGQSRRMGRDKALIPLAGKPLIEHVIDRVHALGDELLITTNRKTDFAYLGVRTVADPVPAAGALTGIHTALHAARGNWVLVLACDMPLLSRPLLEHLISLKAEADVVIPHWAGRFEPLHAIYAKQPCLRAIRSAIDAGHKRIFSFFPQVRVALVEQDTLLQFDPQGLSFFNINTPADLARAERLLAAR